MPKLSLWFCGAMLALCMFATADAAGRTAWTTSKIAGTPNPPAPYAIRPAFPHLKFAKPTSLEQLPGGRMLVSEIGGKLFTFDGTKRNTKQKDLLLTIGGSPKVWHATPHPKFASNGLLFVSYSKGKTSHVSRFKVSGSPPKADPKSETVILTWPAGGHNGGCLRFGNDGMLYISTGDGAGPNPPDSLNAAQDVSNLLGCVLRIDVNKKGGDRDYAIPADNPFIKRKNARPEIWSYGLRNPWKFGIDRKTGNIFAADNGWETWEMVHKIVRGGNCGWPIMEGRAILRSEVKRGPTAIRPPVKDHSHAEANSVIGGPVYRGGKLKDLDGTFIYGDYITGTIWGLKANGNGNGSFSHRLLVDTDQRITAFAESSAGQLLVVDFDYTGQIYELVPSGLKDRSADFPRRLSETGLFRSLKTMTPQPGVVPYNVVVNRWLDGAASQRWVAIPGNGSITLAAGNNKAKYPEGTVFVKHLTLPIKTGTAIPIETQLLHYEHGTWHPYTYAWTGQSDDAVLVETRGADKELTLPTTNTSEAAKRNWHFGAENECRMCHNAGSGFVLGFEPNQLNLLFKGDSGKSNNQLRRLVTQQVIARQPTFPKNNPGRLVNPHDAKQSLDDRARSYLHANCSACHHPGGNAIVSFYLRRELPFGKLNTNKGTGIGTFGIRNAKLIVPGDPYRSILVYRMSKLGYGRMPYIGSRAVDGRGVALIEKWIRAMPHKDRPIDSPPVRAGSAEARALRTMQASRMATYTIKGKPASVLFRSTEGALAAAIGMHNRNFLFTDIEKAVKTQPGDIAGLFEHFVPEHLRKKRLGRNIKPETILSLKGDAARGRLIFTSDVARCRNCHHATDEARSVGPTLVAIRKKYKRRSEMLQHILRPSLKVDDKFATWVAVTKAGKIYNGLLVRRNGKEITIRTAERKNVVLRKSQIDILKKSRKSLMPDAILSDLTPQEAADLLKWFGGL